MLGGRAAPSDPPMIPIRVDGAERAPVTRALIGLNLLIFVGLWLLGPGADGPLRQFGWVPARMTSAESWRMLGPIEQLGPLLTHGFLHVGVLHLLGNLWALHLFGGAVESRVGARPFALLYAGGLTLAATCHALAAPDSVVPMVGASGAIAGVMGACLALDPGARVLTLVPIPIPTAARIPSWLLIGLWAMLQLLAVSAGSATGVAWWAHLGGFAFGGLWGLARRWPPTWALRRLPHRRTRMIR